MAQILQFPTTRPEEDGTDLSNARILIVVDDECGAAHLEECLKSLGYRVCAAVSSGRRALERAGAARPDLALVDPGLGGELTGPETAERIRSRFEVPVVYGIGIRNKDTRVLFSPGYTTKETGSGLGLHSAANFVIGLGGRIQPLSEGTGKGTTMRVTLPLSSVAPHTTGGEGP